MAASSHPMVGDPSADQLSTPLSKPLAGLIFCTMIRLLFCYAQRATQPAKCRTNGAAGRAPNRRMRGRRFGAAPQAACRLAAIGWLTLDHSPTRLGGRQAIGHQDRHKSECLASRSAAADPTPMRILGRVRVLMIGAQRPAEHTRGARGA